MNAFTQQTLFNQKFYFPTPYTLSVVLFCGVLRANSPCGCCLFLWCGDNQRKVSLGMFEDFKEKIKEQNHPDKSEFSGLSAEVEAKLREQG
jgi:hypothetical protein